MTKCWVSVSSRNSCLFSRISHSFSIYLILNVFKAPGCANWRKSDPKIHPMGPLIKPLPKTLSSSGRRKKDVGDGGEGRRRICSINRTFCRWRPSIGGGKLRGKWNFQPKIVTIGERNWSKKRKNLGGNAARALKRKEKERGRRGRKVNWEIIGNTSI